MSQKGAERFVWDVTTALEALGAADVALWTWDPERDRIRLVGAARAMGLGPLAPECGSAALLALVQPQDRDHAEDMLKPQAPGAAVAGRLRMRGAETCIA